MNRSKLGRPTDQRDALFRAVVTALLAHEKIETTEGKARQIKSVADKIITLGKQGDLAARRQAAAFLYDEDVLKKLFDNIGPRYKDRQGGYTRVVKTGFRRGDGAPMAILELV